MLRPITVAMTTNSVRTAAFSISMYACDRPDGKDARLLGVKYTPYWPNNRHDAYIDTIPHARLYLRFQSFCDTCITNQFKIVTGVPYTGVKWSF